MKKYFLIFLSIKICFIIALFVFDFFSLKTDDLKILLWQNLSRKSITDGEYLYFSTLEGYNTKLGKKNMTQLIKYNLKSSTIDSVFFIQNSSEIRNFGITKKFLILAGSLDPAIYKFDLENNKLIQLYNGKGNGMWIHDLAVTDSLIYFSHSSPIVKDSLSFEINIINLNGKLNKIKIPLIHSEGYSGIQTVKPDGTIFFWIGYPIKFFEYNPKTKKLVNRRYFFNGNQFTKISWDFDSNGIVKDLWYNDSSNDLYKSYPIDYFNCDSVIFEKDSLIKVDLFHNNFTQKSYYFSNSSGLFYRKINNIFHNIDIFIKDFKFKIFSQFNDRTEYPINFLHNNNYYLGLVGLFNNSVIFNFTDTKKFRTISNGNVEDFKVNHNNLTKSDFTSLLYLNDSNFYSAGYLTTLDFLKTNFNKNSNVLFQEPVSGFSGQISNFLSMNDSIIFLGGYPKGILLKYNSFKSWNSNSKNIINPSIVNIENDSSDFERVIKLCKVNHDLFVSLSITDYSASKLSKVSLYNSSGELLLSKNFPFLISDLVVSKEFIFVLRDNINNSKMDFLIMDFGLNIFSSRALYSNAFFLKNKSINNFIVIGSKLFKVNPRGNFNFLYNFLIEPKDGIYLFDRKKIILRSTSLIFYYDLNSNFMNFKIRPINEILFNRNSWNSMEHDLKGNVFYTDLSNVKKFNTDQF